MHYPTRDFFDSYYRLLNLFPGEKIRLRNEYLEFSLLEKSSIRYSILIFIGIMALAFLAPLIPPRSSFVPTPGKISWHPVESTEEYWSFVRISVVTGIILFMIVFIPVYLRNTIDISSKSKLTGTFLITRYFRLFGCGLLLLNGWRLFSISKHHRKYFSIKPGYIITINRTITFRVIDYYIRDEQQFKNENL